MSGALTVRPAAEDSMKAERWKRVEELYHAAFERQPEERDRFLEEACAED